MQKDVIQEGDVVIVTGKLDDRIKDPDASQAIGTVVQVGSGQVWVLLSNGNLWIGQLREVFLEKNHAESQT